MKSMMNEPSLLLQRGFILPLCMCICTLLITAGAWFFCTPPASVSQTMALEHAASQLTSQALVKGYSRPEESGAMSCPDAGSDGLSDACANSFATYASGKMARHVKVGAGQLQLAPGTGSSAPVSPNLSLHTAMNAGNDLSRVSDSQAGSAAWVIAFNALDTADATYNSGAQRSASRSESAWAVQERLKTAFMTHLRLSAQAQSKRLSPDWAFAETLHLSYQTDSAGTRFTPVNSGCQCACTKSRCKCACFQTSQWESTGSCVAAPDGGSCEQTSIGQAGGLTRCTAAPGKYCYLAGETWLAKRWAVSLYSPRATEGRACRPERVDSCPLTPKTGTTCSCAFDWPKPLSPDRLSRLRLQFEDGLPKGSMSP